MGKQEIINLLEKRRGEFLTANQIIGLSDKSRTAVRRIINCLHREGDLDTKIIVTGKPKRKVSLWRLRK